MPIERAFRLLKGRFRKLKSLDICNIPEINDIVTAAVCLHNICIRSGDLGEGFDDKYHDNDEENILENLYNDNATGVAKRNHLVRIVNNEI